MSCTKLILKGVKQMAKFIKSKFRVLWGTIFSFFAGMFTTDISSQEAEGNVNDENAI